MKKTAKIILTTFEIIALLAVVTLFVLGAIFYPTQIAEMVARAEDGEQITEPQETAKPEPIVIQVEQDKKDSLSDVFKNNILPYVTAAGLDIITVLAVLFPLIKLKGKNNSLQGMLTAMNKTIETYKAKEGEFTSENFVNALKDTVIEELKGFITTSVENIIKQNVTDNTEALNAIKVSTDVLQAQITGITNAALQVWGESPEARKFLSNVPTAEVLEKYYKVMVDLKAKIDEKNADEYKEATAAIETLGEMNNVE